MAICPLCRQQYWSGILIHNLEGHGIVPMREPDIGDPVYPFDTPATLFVYRAGQAYVCRGCRGPIEQGQLHGSGQFTKDHYCLTCANWHHGTPIGKDERRERIRRQLREDSAYATIAKQQRTIV